MNELRAALVLLGGGIGMAWAVSALPRFRRPVLARRLNPYLGALGPRRSNLLGSAPPVSGLRAVVAPLRDSVAGRLHRFLDDGREIAERLAAAGTGMEVSSFRAEQVTWGLVGAIGGLGFGGVAISAGRSVSPVLVLGMAVAFSVAGVAARDRQLSRAISRRQESIRIALPTVVDLVCLSVTAGESLRGALGMVAESCGGPLSDELRRALRAARAGTPLAVALETRARLVELSSFDRFVAAVVAAQERGIPLADALRSLAFDLREQEKRDLIELAGKKQVSMLVPVIMLILPVAIVFAFYPGVVAIRTLAR